MFSKASGATYHPSRRIEALFQDEYKHIVSVCMMQVNINGKKELIYRIFKIKVVKKNKIFSQSMTLFHTGLETLLHLSPSWKIILIF